MYVLKDINYPVYLLLVSAAHVCYDGDLILTEEFEFNYTGDPDLPFVTGYPAICENNEYVPFCDTGDLTVNEARYACASSTPYSCEFRSFMHVVQVY